jgi:hypothetical protein
MSLEEPPEQPAAVSGIRSHFGATHHGAAQRPNPPARVDSSGVRAQPGSAREPVAAPLHGPRARVEADVDPFKS